MKITKIGWCPKGLKPIFFKNDDREIQIDVIFDTKGNAYDWPLCDWPPRKVRITIETVD